MNEQPRDALPPGARLDGDKYAIEAVLGSGGVGLVYWVRHLLRPLLEGKGLEPAPGPEPGPNPAITTARRAVGEVFRDVCVLRTATGTRHRIATAVSASGLSRI